MFQNYLWYQAMAPQKRPNLAEQILIGEHPLKFDNKHFVTKNITGKPWYYLVEVMK